MMKTSVAVIALVYGVDAARLYSQAVTQLTEDPAPLVVADPLTAPATGAETLGDAGAVERARCNFNFSDSDKCRKHCGPKPDKKCPGSDKHSDSSDKHSGKSCGSKHSGSGAETPCSHSSDSHKSCDSHKSDKSHKSCKSHKSGKSHKSDKSGTSCWESHDSDNSCKCDSHHSKPESHGSKKSCKSKGSHHSGSDWGCKSWKFDSCGGGSFWGSCSDSHNSKPDTPAKPGCPGKPCKPKCSDGSGSDWKAPDWGKCGKDWGCKDFKFPAWFGKGCNWKKFGKKCKWNKGKKCGKKCVIVPVPCKPVPVPCKPAVCVGAAK